MLGDNFWPWLCLFESIALQDLPMQPVQALTCTIGLYSVGIIEAVSHANATAGDTFIWKHKQSETVT